MTHVDFYVNGISVPKVVAVPLVNVGLRVEPSVLARLDKIAALLAVRAKGATVTRSDAARISLVGGIESLERELGASPQGESPARKPKK